MCPDTCLCYYQNACLDCAAVGCAIMAGGWIPCAFRLFPWVSTYVSKFIGRAELSPVFNTPLSMVGNVHRSVTKAHMCALPMNTQHPQRNHSYTKCDRISVCRINRTRPLIALRQGTPSWPGAGAGVPRGSDCDDYEYYECYYYICPHIYIERYIEINL